MNNLSDFYSKLENDVLTYKSNDMDVHFTTIQTGVLMTIYRNGKQYDYRLNSVEEAYYIFKRLEKGKITTEDEDIHRIKVRGLLRYKLNYKSLVTKTILVILGFMIIAAFGAMIFIGIMAGRDRGWNFTIDDIALLIVLLSGFYIGISLILYAFGLQVYETLHIAGSFMTGIGAGMSLYAIDDLRTKGFGAFIGDLLILGIFAGFGILILSLSFEKIKKDVVSIRRTPVLPGKEELEMLRRKVFENHKVLTLSIGPSESPVYLSGTRIGGTPYSDDSFPFSENPDKDGMLFLMQINLSEIDYSDPDNPGSDFHSPLPKKGLLQFYINIMNDFSGEVKALYYPDFNEMKFYNGHDSKSIKIIPSMQPDTHSITVSDFYAAASELNINLAPDLEARDLYDYEIFKIDAGDYLLGPANFYPPSSWSSLGDAAPNRPFLMIEYDSPLLDIFNDKIEFESFQTYINEESLKHHDFRNLKTVMTDINNDYS